MRITGLKIFSEEALIREAGLQNLPVGIPAFSKAAAAIESLLRKRGYALAKAYLIQETPHELILFLDEGRIEKIIFHNLSTPNILRMRLVLKLPKNVYNENLVREKMQWMKTHFNLKSTEAKLVPVRDYANSFFQLDRELKTIIPDITKLPMLDEYRPRYDLEIFIERFPPSEMRGITYGFRTSYSKGLMPFVRYNTPAVFAEKDRGEILTTVGIFYGLDREFDRPPRWTFMELSSHYTLPPFLETHFTPSISGYVYRSWASREDLGLAQYEYLILRGTLAPGVTLFEQFRLNVGYGIERVYLYKSKPVEDESPRIETVDTTDDWTFIEARMNLDVFPISLRRIIDRSAYVSYRYYMNEVTFHRLAILAAMELERENFDMLSIKTNNVLLSHSAPFYYEESVESQTFKGFQGKSYHTKKITRLSASYRFSLYRDYLFAGIFTDGTVFEGSGYDLSGIQKGIAGGVSGHVIFLDQFEFNIYWGKDYLFENSESNYNIFFDFEKKW